MEAEPPPFISPDILEGKYLFLDLDPPGGPELTPVCAGRELCSPHYRVARRGFDYHAVELVIGGSWTLRHRGRTERLRPGALFAYGPGTDYSLEASEGRELIKYFVAFRGTLAERWMGRCGLDDCRVLYIQQVRWIQDLFDQLVDCSRLGREPARDLAGRLTELILRRILCDARPVDERRSESLRTFARCRSVIHESYLELRSVAEVAARCHVDPAYLARLFQRFSSERPLQLLTRLKTQHAADLIMRRGHSVKAAAQAVGFPDPYHFSRVFKRMHGVAPGGILRQ